MTGDSLLHTWLVITVFMLGFVWHSPQTWAHDWYPKSCCSGDEKSGDCKAVKAYVDDDGDWEVYVDEYKRYFKVPPSQIRRDVQPPDMSCHAYYRPGMGMSPSPNFFCFFPCAPRS